MAKAADYEALSRKERQRLEREIQKLYKKAVDDAAAIGAQLPPLDPNKPLDFAKNKSADKSINRIIKRLNDGISRAIERSCQMSWDLANQKNDTLVKNVVRNVADTAIMQAYEARMLERNTAARDAFIKKAEEGFKGSSRVWNNEMFKSELELAMSLGLEKGQSAGSLARDLRHYLNAPDMLFRRVRDKYGNLVLSQRAKAYHPGQGVYRSAYKNALRFAGTTTNMAYRTADYERIQNEHFVVGIEIHLSNNHTTKNHKGEEEPLHDICDILQGKYPKDFMWSGWHPNCRCYMTTILKTAEESREDLRRVMRGEQPLPPEQSKNYVGDTPQAFKDRVKDNEEKLARSSSLPYFVRDNEKYVNEADRSVNAPRTEITELSAPELKYLRDNTKLDYSERAQRLLNNIRTYYGEDSPTYKNFKDMAALADSSWRYNYYKQAYEGSFTPSSAGNLRRDALYKHLAELQKADTSTIPEIWRKEFNSIIEEINYWDFKRKGLNGIGNNVEAAYNILRLSQIEKVQQMGFAKVSTKMPYQIFDDFEKAVPGFSDNLPSKVFFDKFQRFVPLITRSGEKSFYSTTYKQVVIGIGERIKWSNIYHQQIFYHEYGHAYDWANGDMRLGADFRKIYKELVGEVEVNREGLIQEVNKYISGFRADFEKRHTDLIEAFREAQGAQERAKITRQWNTLYKQEQADMNELLGALTDCLQAASKDHKFINPGGHSVSYFSDEENQLAEFFAHCNECYWQGNPYFEKMLPKLYKLMREYILNH